MANQVVKLKSGNDYLYPQSVLNGIDTNNVLGSNLTSYTATQDCWLICVFDYQWAGSWVFEGLSFKLPDLASYEYNCYIWILKKGQTFKCTKKGGTGKFNVYGILR